MIRCLYLWFIIFSLLSTSLCFAQKSYTTDTLKVRKLYAQAYKFATTNNNTQARSLAQQQVVLSESINFIEGRNLGYELIGYTYLVENKYVEALEIYFQLISFKDNHRRYGDLARFYLNIAYAYFKVGLYEDALKYYDKINDLNQHSIKLPVSIMADLVYYQALVYETQTKYDEAFYNFNKALTLRIELKDQKSVGVIYNKIAKLYERKNDYAQAFNYYTKYINEAKKIKDKNETSLALYGIGILYQKVSKIQKAEESFLNALEISKEAKNYFVQSVTSLELTKLYIIKNNISLALEYALTVEKIATAINNKEILLEVIQLLSAIYEKLDNPQKALAYQKKHNELLISQNEDRTRIAVMENQLKNSVQKYEIEREKILQEQQMWVYLKYTFMGLGGLALLVGISLFFIYRYRRINTHQDETIHTLAHDLKNSAGNAVALMEFFKKGMGNEYLDIAMKQTNKMFNAVNQILDAKSIEKRKLNIRKEVFNLSENLKEQLIPYEKKAREKGIELEYLIPPKLYYNLDKTIFMFIVDNLLSNAIKYTRLGSKINVALISSENMVHLIVNNTGSVISKDDQLKLFKKYGKLSNKPTGADESSTGLGLFSVARILKAIQGKISCESNPTTGTTFTVIFKV